MRPLLITAPVIRRLFSALGVDVIRFRSAGIIGYEALYRVYTNSRGYWDWQALQTHVAKQLADDLQCQANVEIVRHEIIMAKQCLVFHIALTDIDRPATDDLGWLSSAEPISSDN